MLIVNTFVVEIIEAYMVLVVQQYYSSNSILSLPKHQVLYLINYSLLSIETIPINVERQFGMLTQCIVVWVSKFYQWILVKRIDGVLKGKGVVVRMLIIRCCRHSMSSINIFTVFILISDIHLDL